MISLLLTLILVLVNPLCAYLDNGDVEIDTNSVYTFHETVGEYREIDFEGNPTIMKGRHKGSEAMTEYQAGGKEN